MKTGGKRAVWQILNGERVQMFESISEAARQLNLDNRSIGSVLKGGSKQCGGYQFEYVNQNIEGEVWQQHPKGFYVSNLGRIQMSNGYITTGWKQRDAYHQVRIKSKSFYVHRLVLEAFVGECPEGFECDHIDRNRSNNCLQNLRWITIFENRRRATYH